MIEFIKKKFGPDNCDDEKLALRTVRAAKVNGITNFWGCCGSWSVMAGIVSLPVLFFGLPWLVPAVLVGGGIATLASAIPVIKVTDKIENIFVRECQRRKVCPPGWDRDYFIPPEPQNDNKPPVPVLADVFDPIAAIALGEKITVGPALKLKRKTHAFRKS